MADEKNILNLIPKKTKFKLKHKFLFFSYYKTYSVREYSFRDKIYFCHKYGQDEFFKKLTDVDGVGFEMIYFEIVYRLMSNRHKSGLFAEFKTFNKFTAKIIGYEAEAGILIAGLEAVGVSTTPKMTKEEIKEATDNTKKKEMK